jgi:hypothetical protein
MYFPKYHCRNILITIHICILTRALQNVITMVIVYCYHGYQLILVLIMPSKLVNGIGRKQVPVKIKLSVLCGHMQCWAIRLPVAHSHCIVYCHGFWILGPIYPFCVPPFISERNLCSHHWTYKSYSKTPTYFMALKLIEDLEHFVKISENW